jgi:hypothetical protein
MCKGFYHSGQTIFKFNHDISSSYDMALGLLRNTLDFFIVRSDSENQQPDSDEACRLRRQSQESAEYDDLI